MNYKITENDLKEEDFIRLFKSAGWGEVPYDIVSTSLKNSYATFSVKAGEQVIAMGRLLGDGGMAFFLKDLIVQPEYQGRGIGRALLVYIEEYIKGQLKEGWRAYFQLVSAKGKEGFYQKCGYVEHPGENSGPAYSRWISG